VSYPTESRPWQVSRSKREVTELHDPKQLDVFSGRMLSPACGTPVELTPEFTLGCRKLEDLLSIGWSLNLMFMCWADYIPATLTPNWHPSVYGERSATVYMYLSPEVVTVNSFDRIQLPREGRLFSTVQYPELLADVRGPFVETG